MLAGGGLVGTLNQTKTSNLLELFGKYIHGAEGETRTRMGLLPLDPEPSEWVFGNSLYLCNYSIFKEFINIHNIQKMTKYTQYKQYMDTIWSQEFGSIHG